MWWRGRTNSGPVRDRLAVMPGMPGGGPQLKDLQVDERELARAEAIISSMTPQERALPQVINGSRRLRIARGSGTTTQQVNSLLKEFAQAKRMMKSMMGMMGGPTGRPGRALPKGVRMPRGKGLPGMPNVPGLS